MLAGREGDHVVRWDRAIGSAGVVLVRRAARALDLMLRWHAVSRQRRALRELDDHMLKDIGITRADAEQEARRPFWDEAAERWRDWL